MSAEEYISLAYAGCNSNDMDCYIGEEDCYQEITNSESGTKSRVRCRDSSSVESKRYKNQKNVMTLTSGKTNQEESSMATSQLIEKRIVTVTFVGSSIDKEYAYCTDILDIKQGDCVVVDTQYGAKTANVSKVKGLSKQARSLASKWVICRVDLEEFKKRLEKYELISEIEAEIEEEMRSQARIDYYRRAAETSPRIAELLQSLETLSKPQLEAEKK